MKKIISVLLAMLMMFSSMAVIVGASYISPETGTEIKGSCECADHNGEKDCTCCVFCSTTTDNLRTKCANKVPGLDDTYYYEVCCGKCTGVYPCDCGCPCCDEQNEDFNDKNDSTLDQYWGEKEQEEFVDGFQAILKKISDFFDMIFDAIFEFLRLDEVLGRDTSAE